MFRELVLCAIALPALAQMPTHVEARDFTPGGKLRIQFRAGDLKIVRGADAQHIVLRYTAERGDDHKDGSGRAKLQFEATAAEVTLKLDSSADVHLHAVIEVPGAVDLTVRMLAGDLIVDAVEGSIDLHNSFGDIVVMGSEKQYTQLYKSIDASVGIGDVEGLAFEKSRGWLGRTGELSGQGEYSLRARVSVGDIRFLPGELDRR
jgi:hypothetical protein